MGCVPMCASEKLIFVRFSLITRVYKAAGQAGHFDDYSRKEKVEQLRGNRREYNHLYLVCIYRCWYVAKRFEPFFPIIASAQGKK